MEIGDYWHGLGRRRWLLVTAPVAAALAALGVGLQHPADREAVTTVQVPVANGDGPIVARRQISDFQSLLISDAVLTRAAEETKVRVSTIKAALSQQQVGAGTAIEVHVVGPPSMHPRDVSSAVAATTVDLFTRAQRSSVDAAVSQAKAVVAQTQRDADAAAAAIDSFVASSGHPSPRERYSSVRAAANQASSQLAVAKQHGWTAVEQETEARLKSLTKQLAVVGKQADAFTARLSALSATRQQRLAALSAAERSLVTAEASPARNTLVGGVVATTERRVARRTSLEQLAAAAAIAGFVVAGAGLLLPALRQRRRGRWPRAGGEDGGEPHVGVPAGSRGGRAGVAVRQHARSPARQR